jgi:hypothetical protein
VNTTLEAGFFEVAEATAAAKHLSLYDVAATLELASHFLGLISGERDVSERDRNLMGVQERASLVFV